MTTSKRYTQYILVGALLGLYNGLFYRSSGDTDLEIAVELALFAAVVTVGIRSWKKKLPFMQILKDFLAVTASYLIFLLSLAFRKLALDTGGRPLMILECVLAGAILGLLLAWDWQKRKERNI